MTTPNDYAFKYEKRQQNPFDRLHTGEPWMFFKPSDKCSAVPLKAYADELKKESDKALARGEEQLSKELFKESLGMLIVLEHWLTWQEEHPDWVKFPD